MCGLVLSDFQSCVSRGNLDDIFDFVENIKSKTFTGHIVAGEGFLFSTEKRRGFKCERYLCFS